MQYIDGMLQPNCTNGAVRVPTVLIDDLEYAGASEPAERLGVRMLVACLCQVERVASCLLYFRGELPKIFPG